MWTNTSIEELFDTLTNFRDFLTQLSHTGDLTTIFPNKIVGKLLRWDIVSPTSRI